jgi:L-seryl-tRNA(Ser) seleniumtransferase
VTLGIQRPDPFRLDGLRTQALAGSLAASAVAPDKLLAALQQRVLERLAPRLRRVINLTGTVIHTNPGRALLADSALQHVLAMMAGPNNLEDDLRSGSRGDRGDRGSVVEELLCMLTGEQAATVVNNNAADMLLTIAALARGQEVIVSRGELVEIGGAFCMPDVMAAGRLDLRQPVIRRISDGRLLQDLRCLEDTSEFAGLLPALRDAPR